MACRQQDSTPKAPTIAGLEKPGERNQLPTFSFPELADGQVGRNAIDVGGECIASLVSISRSIYPHKSLLSQIHSPIVVVCHSVDITRDLIAISTNQLSKCVLISRPRRFQQRVVGSSILQRVLL